MATFISLALIAVWLLVVKDLLSKSGDVNRLGMASGCLGILLSLCVVGILYPLLFGPPDANGLGPGMLGIWAMPIGASLGIWLWRRLGGNRRP